MLVIKQLLVPIDFHSIYFPTKSMGTNNCLIRQGKARLFIYIYKYIITTSVGSNLLQK